MGKSEGTVLSGAQIVMECLLEQRVDVVFGYPGGQILPVYDALYAYGEKIRHILTAHEQAAAHAADGYARASGGVGVCFATSGPGATNLVTGIATAYMDSIPMVAITGNVSTHQLGTDGFQEADIVGITLPVTKHGYIIKDVNHLADALREAFYIARSGRPGPVLVDIPRDVQLAQCAFYPARPRAIEPRPAEQTEVARALELLAASERPVILAGGGAIAANAAAELARFAEILDAPVATTLMGTGAFPGTHARHLGMAGMHGSTAANGAIQKADLLIAVGTRFSDRILGSAAHFARGARILQIDIDRAEIDKNVRVHAQVNADVRCALLALIEGLAGQSHPEWMREALVLKNGVQDQPQEAIPGAIDPQALMRTLYSVVGGRALITTEVGQHQMWAAQFYPVDEARTFLTSGGFGTMGYGAGAAIGAQLARPDKRVINIAGDGSFRMNMAELATMCHYGLPVIVVLVNNGTLGMVRQWQTLFYERKHSQVALERGPDFIKLAEAFGITGYRACSEKELSDALYSALDRPYPALIECVVDPEALVFPMVPPGAPLDAAILD